MKNVIASYVLRYGLETLLTEIGEGLTLAESDIKLSASGRREMVSAATEVFRLRNELRNAV